MDFLDWWHKTGSGLHPQPGEDMEDHAKFVAFMAWQAALEKSSKPEDINDEY